ncbi:hypothetical protein Tco_1409028, partial [Tanacetum coccineum]
MALPTEIYALDKSASCARIFGEDENDNQGTSLTKQERECKLYDEFNKFTYKKERLNTKFLNTLPGEWSKFVTNVKLVKDLRTTNVDQRHAYLQQHERHANEVRLMHERNPDPLALVASHQLTQPTYQSHLQPLTLHYPSRWKKKWTVQPVQGRQTTYAGCEQQENTTLLKKWSSFIRGRNSIFGRSDFLDIQNSRQSWTTMLLISDDRRPMDLIVMTQLSKIVSWPISQGMAQMHVTEYLSGNTTGKLSEFLLFAQQGCPDLSMFDQIKNTSDALHTAQMERLPEIKNEILIEKLALEKKLNQLDNIIFKRGQSAQTVHMMTKSKICYDHSSKQAIGFEKPFYLKKARESKPKLYDGNTILKMDTIVIPDSNETLELSEEIPKELPTVSMVNTSLKELKRHLTGFDQVVKERTTATKTSLRGTSGRLTFQWLDFEDEIIPFIKELKDIFNNFNQYLVEELADVQKVFYQMEQAVEQHRLESRTFEVKINQVLSENERLLAQAIDNDIVKTVVNLSMNDGCETVNECQKCLELKTELLNIKDVVDKETYDKLCKNFTTLEKHCITLEADSQLNQEKFQQKNSILDQNAPSFTQLFELRNVDDSKVKIDMDEIETLNIELEHRVTKLVAENEHLKQTYKQLYDSIKPKRVQSKEQCDALIKQVNIKSGEISDLNAKLQEQVSKDNVEPITPKLLNKRTAHSSYIKHTQEEAFILRDINSKKHDNSDYVCINGDDCMSSDNLCVSNSMNDVKSAKPKKRKS